MSETLQTDSRLAALRSAVESSDQSIAPGALFAWLVDEGKLELPLPGNGETALRFSMLRTLGGQDLSLARLAEGHVDALAILEEADCRAPDGARLGVWAAGPVDSLQAVSVGSGWRLDGIRRWCSGTSELTHALIRAEAGDGERVFLVSLELPGIRPVEGSWPAVGMAASSTFDVVFDRVELSPATAIGDPGFYLRREGFWFGAAGVAAVWLGGAEAVAAPVAQRTGLDPHRLAHLGWISARLTGLDALLFAVAEAIDVRSSDALLIKHLAHVLRAEVAAGAAEILDRTGRATGADPLAHDRVHAQRVADLTLYIRQSHAEADLEQIGRLELELRARREQAGHGS